MKHLNGFNQVGEMSEMIAKLDNNLLTKSTKAPSYIQMENNDKLKGISFINPLYEAIKHQQTLLIEYKSFKSKQASKEIYYPYLLKEYRNRWFILVRNIATPLLYTLALDRIQSIHTIANVPYIAYQGIDFDTYFKDTIGVTKTEKDRARKVVLLIDTKTAPYVKTKPLHSSQQILSEKEEGTLVQLDVVLNFELERELLGFGETLKVLEPKVLKKRIEKRISKMHFNYQND